MEKWSFPYKGTCSLCINWSQYCALIEVSMGAALSLCCSLPVNNMLTQTRQLWPSLWCFFIKHHRCDTWTVVPIHGWRIHPRRWWVLAQLLASIWAGPLPNVINISSATISWTLILLLMTAVKLDLVYVSCMCGRLDIYVAYIDVNCRWHSSYSGPTHGTTVYYHWMLQVVVQFHLQIQALILPHY